MPLTSDPVTFQPANDHPHTLPSGEAIDTEAVLALAETSLQPLTFGTTARLVDGLGEERTYKLFIHADSFEQARKIARIRRLGEVVTGQVLAIIPAAGATTMTRAEITDTVFHTVAEEFGVELDEINAGTRFDEDLGSDSLSCVEITMAIEDDFEIHIDDDQADATKTVGQLIDLVASILGVPAE